MRLLVVLALLAALAGCGSGGSAIHVTDLPPECAGDTAGLLKALRSAPSQVRVDGESISDCFKSHDAADIEALGTTLLLAAQRLGDRAADDAQAATELGYLIGAARRGEAHNGVMAELVRRLEGETGALGRNRAAYARGLQAGLAKG